MVETLLLKFLRDEDAPIFGGLNVALAKLKIADIQTGDGFVVTAPDLHLKTVLEHFDFGKKEIFEQSLTLVKRDLEKIPVPEELEKITKNHELFLINYERVKSSKKLWLMLLFLWLETIKERLWRDGFYLGITENLQPQVVTFVKNPLAFGEAYYIPELDETIIDHKFGNLLPLDSKKLDEIVQLANKKLFMPYKYEWILDNGLRITKVLPYTPLIHLRGEDQAVLNSHPFGPDPQGRRLVGEQQTYIQKPRSAVKVFLDLSSGLIVEQDIDGIYISSEKIFNLNAPNTSFENLIFKLVESAENFPDTPILVKLADMSEGLPALPDRQAGGRQGMGKIRGTLRLIHQKSLLDPICEAILFARNKKDLINIHVVIPFVRGVNELEQIKRELAVNKLTRKNSLQQWLELSVPENLVNLEEYLVTGIDGVILNLDELSAHFGGYDHTQQDLAHYKHEVLGLLKFMEDGVKLMHKLKVPFIAYGDLSLNPTVLEFLVEKGVCGVVVERYEAPSAKDLLHQAERRMILAKAS